MRSETTSSTASPNSNGRSTTGVKTCLITRDYTQVLLKDAGQYGARDLLARTAMHRRRTYGARGRLAYTGTKYLNALRDMATPLTTGAARNALHDMDKTGGTTGSLRTSTDRWAKFTQAGKGERMPRNPPQTAAMKQRTEDLKRRASSFLKNPVRTILGTTPGWRERVRKRDAPEQGASTEYDASDINKPMGKVRPSR